MKYGGNGIGSSQRPTGKPLMSPWRQFAYLDAWIPVLSLTASALFRESERMRMKERKMEREWVDLTNLFCFQLPVCYCYKKSQSIMQSDKKIHRGKKEWEWKTGKWKKREGKREENHATCTSLIWLLALRTMAGNKCMEIFPLIRVCVCAHYLGSRRSPRSVLTSPSDRDNRVGPITITLCLSAH